MGKSQNKGPIQLAFDTGLAFVGHLFAQLDFVEIVNVRPNSAVGPLGDADKAKPLQPTIRAALESCHNVFVSLGVISGVINILMLTGSFFMLQVYDRVLPSQSVPTLVGLALLATALFALQGALEVIRSRVNVRIGAHLDQTISSRVYDALVRLPLRLAVMVTACNRFEISITSEVFSRAAAPRLSSICRGCLSISGSVFFFMCGSE